MKKIYILAGNIAFVSILLIFSLIALNSEIHEDYIVLYVLVIMFVLLPFLDIFYSFIDSYKSGNINPEKYLYAMDSVLSIKSIDDFLNKRFNYILHLMKVETGSLIIYDREYNDFVLYKQDKRKKNLNAAGRLSGDNILLNIIKSPDDVIIRKKITSSTPADKLLIEEMKKINAEIIVPIFYSDFFLGSILLGKRKFNYNYEDIITIKLIAKKIAAISINRFFMNEMQRKKELEKERSLARKVLRSFFPKPNLSFGKIKISTYYNNPSYLIDKFYNSYTVKSKTYFTSYMSGTGDQSDIIYLPTVNSLLRYYAEEGLNFNEAVNKMNFVLKDKLIFDEYVKLFHCCISEDGIFEYTLQGHPEPFIFSAGTFSRSKENKINMLPGDVIIICNDFAESILEKNTERICSILQNSSDTDIVKIKESMELFLKHNYNLEYNFLFFGFIKLC